MSPQTTNTATVPVTPIVTAIPSTHPNFSKFMAVLAALEPVMLAGISPWLKTTNAQTIAVTEAPVAQALFQALSAL